MLVGTVLSTMFAVSGIDLDVGLVGVAVVVVVDVDDDEAVTVTPAAAAAVATASGLKLSSDFSMRDRFVSCQCLKHSVRLNSVMKCELKSSR